MVTSPYVITWQPVNWLPVNNTVNSVAWLNQAVAPIDVNALYGNYINQFSQTNPEVANRFKEYQNGYNQFGESQRNLQTLYGNFQQNMNPEYENFARLNQWLNQDITGLLQNQLQTAYNQYWPQWAQTKRVEDYYANIANVLAQQNAVDLGNVNASARSAWASVWAVSNAQKMRQLDMNKQLIDLKSKEIQDYWQIYNALNQYLDNFVTKYGNSQDKYIRGTREQLLNYKQNLESNLLSSYTALEQARLQQVLQQQARATVWSGVWSVQDQINKYLAWLKSSQEQAMLEAAARARSTPSGYDPNKFSSYAG